MWIPFQVIQEKSDGTLYYIDKGLIRSDLIGEEIKLLSTNQKLIINPQS